MALGTGDISRNGRRAPDSLAMTFLGLRDGCSLCLSEPADSLSSKSAAMAMAPAASVGQNARMDALWQGRRRNWLGHREAFRAGWARGPLILVALAICGPSGTGHW